MSELVLVSHNREMVIPSGAVKDHLHRLSVFAIWLDATGHSWRDPDRAAYRAHLLARGLQKSSVTAHLATIRARYKALLRDNHLRDHLYGMTPEGLSPADKKAFVDEALTRLNNAADPAAAPVT